MIRAVARLTCRVSPRARSLPVWVAEGFPLHFPRGARGTPPRRRRAGASSTPGFPGDATAGGSSCTADNERSIGRGPSTFHIWPRGNWHNVPVALTEGWFVHFGVSMTSWARKRMTDMLLPAAGGPFSCRFGAPRKVCWLCCVLKRSAVSVAVTPPSGSGGVVR